MGLKRIRILFVCPYRLTTGAGGEQFVINVASHAPSECEVNIVATQFEDRRRLSDTYVAAKIGTARLYHIRSFKILQAEFNSLVAPLHGTRMLRSMVILAGFVAQRFLYFRARLVNRSILKELMQADLIYLLQNDDWAYFCPSYRGVIIGSTHASDLPSEIATTLSGRILTQLAYREIDGFHFLDARLSARSLVHRDYDFVIPNGVDTALFYPPGDAKSSGGPMKVLFVGRLEEQKGLSMLLEAWRTLGTSNAELHIVGTGSLEQLVKKTALSYPTVKYHGVLSTEEVAELYRASDVYVLPTLADQYPLSVLEAISSGNFVIVGEAMAGTFDEFKDLGLLSYTESTVGGIRTQLMGALGDLPRIRSNRSRGIEYLTVAKRDWNSIAALIFAKFADIISRKRNSKPL